MLENTPKPITSFTIRANGGVLVGFKFVYTMILVVAIYIYITIGFPLLLLLLFAAILLIFILWSNSIYLTVSRESISFKIGIATVQTFLVDEIGEIAMGNIPYGLHKTNLLAIRSTDPQKKDIKINYFFLFRRRELSTLLKLILDMNPQIIINQKAKRFLSN